MGRLQPPIVQKRLLVGKKICSIGTIATDRDLFLMKCESDAEVFYTTNGAAPDPYAPAGSKSRKSTRRYGSGPCRVNVARSRLRTPAPARCRLLCVTVCPTRHPACPLARRRAMHEYGTHLEPAAPVLACCAPRSHLAAGVHSAARHDGAGGSDTRGVMPTTRMLTHREQRAGHAGCAGVLPGADALTGAAGC